MATQPFTDVNDPAFVYGQGPDLHSLNALAAEIAQTDIPVLLVGESGTGKDVYARLIHRLSGRTENSLTKINCSAPDAGQLLNDVRAAMLGADVPDAPGAFVAADERGGLFETRTVFLDGVHELDSVCQRVLLSLLPDGEPRNGAAKATRRFISSTSCNFEKEIEAGRFRLELYFRINGVILRLPPLRDRKEDIPDLLECFLAKHANELRKNSPELSREARKLLFAYDWPGNIRELENVARKIVAVGDAELALGDLRASRIAQPTGGDGASSSSLKVAARAASRKTERELILKALEQTHWNRKRAARDLQISYKSLLYKIKQIGGEVPLAGKGGGKAR
jgi:two-component system, NtrC family, response regulator AtoC